MILAVESFPRSGNSLFQGLACELGPTWVYGGNDLMLVTEFPEALNYGVKYEPDGAHLDRDYAVILKKIHGVPDSLTCDFAVHIHRNPVDALHSYCEMSDYDGSSYDGWMTVLLDAKRPDSWGSYVRGRIADPKVKLHLGFEEMLQCGSEFIKSNLESVGFSFPMFKHCTVKFDDLHKKRPQFFRSGTIGQQPRKAEYADRIRATYKYEMRLLGYE